MTATTVTPTSAALAAPTRQPPVLPNLLRSEWAKIRSVRSTYWSLAAAVAVMIGYGAIDSASHTGARHGTFAPVLTSLSGVLLAQLAIGVLGVLVITTEYSTAMIRSTFAAAPQRHSVIIAKAGVLGAAAFTVGTVASLIACPATPGKPSSPPATTPPPCPPGPAWPCSPSTPPSPSPSPWSSSAAATPDTSGP